MKKLICLLVLIMLFVSCGSDEVALDDVFEEDTLAERDLNDIEDAADYDGAIEYDDEEVTPIENDEDENGCLPHETYDAETETCDIIILCETDEECDEIVDELYAGYEDVELEDWDMKAEDCLPGEAYDELESVCYILCDTEEECDAMAAEIYAGADVYYIDDFAGHGTVRNARQSAETILDEGTIAAYTFNSDLEISLLNVDEEADADYADLERHAELWRFISRILPNSVLRAEASQFHVFTDGPSDTLAFVAPLPDDKSKWLIGFDIVDSGVSGPIGGELGLGEFVHTTIHEFAHIISLENDQVPPDESLTPEEIEEGYVSFTELECPTYYTGEGCANESSYMALFYAEFWTDLQPTYEELVWSAETEEEYYDGISTFYEEFGDQFVSPYAASNPAEDIAESYAAFVLKNKPEGDSIADEKVRFFYQFEPLVRSRNYIRSQLARYAGE